MHDKEYFDKLNFLLYRQLPPKLQGSGPQLNNARKTFRQNTKAKYFVEFENKELKTGPYLCSMFKMSNKFGFYQTEKRRVGYWGV